MCIDRMIAERDGVGYKVMVKTDKGGLETPWHCRPMRLNVWYKARPRYHEQLNSENGIFLYGNIDDAKNSQWMGGPYSLIVKVRYKGLISVGWENPDKQNLLVITAEKVKLLGIVK